MRGTGARHQLSRHEREQHYQRLTLIGAGVIVLIVLLLVGVGWYQSYVRPYQQTVITVGSMRADMRYFIKRLKEVIPQFANSDPQVVLNIAPDSTRDQIEQELILLQRAPTAGVTATEAEVDEQIMHQLGIILVNGAAPDRSQLEAGIANKLRTTGLSLGEYRQEMRAKALRDKLQAKLGDDYPKSGPQAKYEEMVLNKQDDANTALDRLNKGESWEAVTADVRKSPTVGSIAQFDFQPKLQMDQKLADALFGLDDGQHSGVVATGDGKFVVALLIQKDNQRPLSDDQVKGLVPKLYSSWMDDQRKTLKIKENLSDEQKLFAIVHSDWHPSQQQQQGQAPGAPVQPGLPPGISTSPGIPAQPAAPPSSGATTP